VLYIVGGCSRSGKSLLAERMRSRHGIPWLTLDAIKMGLALGVRGLGVEPSGDDLTTADQMWPVVEPILDHAVFDGRPYLVEGVNLRPRTIAHYVADLDTPVRVCFLGYPDVAIEEKTLAVSNYRGLPSDWLNRTGPVHVQRYLTISRDLSGALRNECREVGLPFIDTGVDFFKGLELAEQILRAE
jgi:2-phosphoglycerate kinase